MTPDQIRIEALRLSDPKLSNPDVDLWIDRAKKLEAYISSGEGQSSQDAPQKPAVSDLPKARVASSVKSPAQQK